jgi:gluconate 2-dehydrogenase gamma chain
VANQNPSRRELLEMLSRVTVVSQFPGFSKWMYAGEDTIHHKMDEIAPTRPAHYEPQFFTPAQYALVERLVDLIIPPDGPPDESPGAKEAGVAEFIDFMAANDPEMMQPFRNGLTWLDGFAHSSAGTVFIRLDTARQETLLSQLAYQKQHQPGQGQASNFLSSSGAIR